MLSFFSGTPTSGRGVNTDKTAAVRVHAGSLSGICVTCMVSSSEAPIPQPYTLRDGLASSLWCCPKEEYRVVKGVPVERRKGVKVLGQDTETGVLSVDVLLNTVSTASST